VHLSRRSTGTAVAAIVMKLNRRVHVGVRM
jgi:hypothetical protein